MKNHILFTVFFIITRISLAQEEIPQYGIFELSLTGNMYGVKDNPVRDVELITQWQHETGSPVYRIHGFYDGNGNGEFAGNQFKVRFCPTKPGTWILKYVISNDDKLNKQKEGMSIICTESEHPGFWVVDQESKDQRWYRRSDGSHPYITGNTFYSFLSGYEEGKSTGKDFEKDIEKAGEYFNKIRFAITGDIYPDKDLKPFYDAEGNPTDEGNYSFRPNPEWFRDRVDRAVAEMHERDIIADIILNGPDSYDARSALLSKFNSLDPEPFLRYMAARYGSYPNVWFCLSNEYNIRDPRYTEKEIVEFGNIIKIYNVYEIPVSVHANHQDWDPQLNSSTDWNDHVIIQNKMKHLRVAADKTELNYWKGGRKPVINDEIAYQGEGDGWSEEDVIEVMLGAFLGGGYSSTGYKSGSKKGHYFSGGFSVREHSAADNIKWMRDIIDENISFWKMKPYDVFRHIDAENGARLDRFYNVNFDVRMISDPENEYVLGTDDPVNDIRVRLPDGKWTGAVYDVINMKKIPLGKSIVGEFIFSLPESRAVFVHFKKVE